MAAQSLVVPVLLLLLSFPATYSYAYARKDIVCQNNTKYTEWRNMKCEMCSCTGENSMWSCVGCSVLYLPLTQEQIDRGCYAKWVEKTPFLRYPECCRKYIHCPE
ncbi:uncharacterized protein [Watersipora subatra]|uniref:uncharacterized protein n=1 Tax=Watersipora subatra TaxID=2589382 RepID=UPI00355AED1D